MGREKVLCTMSFPGILFPLTYAIYFHNKYINQLSDNDILYKSFLTSLKISSSIFLMLIILLYFFSIQFGGPLLYIFFSFMGYLVNLFNSSMIIIIFEKIFKIYLLEEYKLSFYYGIGLLMSIYGHIRAERICFDKVEINVPQWKGEDNTKVKIAHLSDLHLCPIYGKKLVEKIVYKLNSIKDLSFIVLTGDIVDGDMFDNKITSDILAPFKNSKYKIYYVSGNHEEFTDKNRLFFLLKEVGIIHLNNKVEIFEKYKLNLIGIDYDKNYKKVKNEIIPDLCNYASKKNKYINIAICHIPFFKPKHLVKYNIFLFLCGHTHGAQMIPTNIYVWIKNTVFCGLYSYLGKYFVYCVSGVGNSGPPLRTFSRANIGLITLSN